jgi:hypothetical protein
VMFGSRTMCLGGIFVVFGGLVMFVSGHGILAWFVSSQAGRTRGLCQRS